MQLANHGAPRLLGSNAAIGDRQETPVSLAPLAIFSLFFSIFFFIKSRKHKGFRRHSSSLCSNADDQAGPAEMRHIQRSGEGRRLSSHRQSRTDTSVNLKPSRSQSNLQS